MKMVILLLLALGTLATYNTIYPMHVSLVAPSTFTPAGTMTMTVSYPGRLDNTVSGTHAMFMCDLNYNNYKMIFQVQELIEKGNYLPNTL